MKKINSTPSCGLIDAVKNNDEEAVKYWIEEKHASLTLKDAERQTAAHIAAANNNIGILEYLLRRDDENFLIKAKNCDGFTVIQVAVQKDAIDVVKYLGNKHLKNADLFRRTSKPPKNNVLHIGALNGHLDTLKYLVKEKGGDVNVQNHFKESPLFLAIQKQHFNIVEYLVSECNANLKLTDSSGNTVLHIASSKGDLKVAKYLLDYNRTQFNVNAKNNYGETCLYKAVMFNHTAIAEYLISEEKVDLNSGDFMNKTPLYQAAFLGHVELVKYLVEHGADTEIKDSMGKKPVEATVCLEVIDYLKKLPRKRNRRSLAAPPSGKDTRITCTRLPNWLAENLDGRLLALIPDTVATMPCQGILNYHRN